MESSSDGRQGNACVKQKKLADKHRPVTDYCAQPTEQGKGFGGLVCFERGFWGGGGGWWKRD